MKDLSKKQIGLICSWISEIMRLAFNREINNEKFEDCFKEKFAVNWTYIEKEANVSLEDYDKQILRFSASTRESLKSVLDILLADNTNKENLINKLNLDINDYELELRADWRDEEGKIIGYYSKKDDGTYRIDDIRSLGFSELPYKDGSEVVIETEKIQSLQENTYYEFSWTTKLDDSKRGFHVIPKDNNFKMVCPKELVDRLYKMWEGSNLDVIKQLSDVQRMVNTQLTASSDGTFIYELLQNANDYPVIGKKGIELVDVEFHITDHYLIYRHTGRYFSPRNIAAISKMSDGEKKKEKNAIGYKGIGFKTVFSENQYVFLKSGEYNLRFDQSITEESTRFPWQIMPIWTPLSEVADEVTAIMDENDSFRVQMAIRPDDSSKLREGEKSFELIFNDIFKDEKDILFIPNIKSVKVFYDGEEQICRTKDPQKWALTKEPLIYKFSEEEIEENNREVVSNKRIPEKYKDFEDTRISFACQREGNKLLPVDNARIYCYLPTQVSLGFPFLMNTDMIPTGPRDDFEKKIKFNHKLMKIAGGKLAEWVGSLLKCGEFDLCSVFSIVPNFKAVENYEDFIEEFEEGFNEELDDLELIPTESGEYANVHDLLIDETGLTSSGIMTDEEFLKFSNKEGILPAKELRSNRKFKSFVKRYIDDECIFEEASLHDMIKDESFVEWLKNQENNNKFLKFLLDKKMLENFLEDSIFIENDERELYKASDLYYDIDETLEDMSSFSKYLYYLSKETRKFFNTNEDWARIVDGGSFAVFNANEFVNDTLLSENWDDVVSILGSWDVSYHFYNFLTKNNIVPVDLISLPFFNDDDQLIDCFEEKIVFFSSENAKTVCSSSWLSSVPFYFISSKYDKNTLEYFKNNELVREFSNEIIVNEIILSEEYKSQINESQQENEEISKSFIDYCYQNKDLFDLGALSDYALAVFDCNGGNLWDNENTTYFPSSCFDEYSSKSWLNEDWMYCLNSVYLDGRSNVDKKSFKEFLRSAFYVKELDDKLFYRNVVRKNIDDIIANTQGDKDPDGEKNVDFVSYLNDNYQLIFNEDKDEDKFDSFVFIEDDLEDGTPRDIPADASHIYVYDEDLIDIVKSEWFPSDLINICSKQYESSDALLKMGAKKFKFSDFFDDVIVSELDAINDNIKTKDASIAFHNFIIDHLSKLTDDQKKTMKDAKVFLYGSETASDSSGDHKILSAKARELFDTGLVEFSDLDIIDPDYKTESHSEYWESCLGNSKFTVSDFISWLGDNVDTFYTTIEEKESNIIFWRWVKENKISDASLKELPVLPIFLKGIDQCVGSDNTIFLSDDYTEGEGIESIVLGYSPDASFVSPEYLTEDDNIEDWKKLWIKLGIRVEMVDILIDTIDNRLDEINDPKLPATIAKYRNKLDEHYDGDLISQLTDLQVLVQDGNFYAISDIIYVDCEKTEPFKYINLPNQASFATADERKLIIDIVDEVGGNKISKLTEWQQAKIDRYLEIQEEDEDELRDIHFLFVDELAKLYNEDRKNLDSFENLKDVMFLNSENDFFSANELTLSSVYNPYCDFEKFGLEYEYLSSSYKSQCKFDVRSLLNWKFDVHCNFQKEDINNLSNREFSIYFWSKYLAKKDIPGSFISSIRKNIEDGLFDDVECIPTKDYMKKPSDVYSLYISSYVKNVDDWENKLPLSSLPDIALKDGYTLFGLLLKEDKLSFRDALYALFKTVGQDRRIQLLRWILESYEDSYEINIDEYRNDKDALWKNVKNEDVHISKLYALDHGDKMLEQYFGSLPQIINKDYFPGSDFNDICDILKISIIKAEDLIVDPLDKRSRNDLKKSLKIYSLIFAGFEDEENWNSLYDDYCSRIEEMNLWSCSSISVIYKEDRSICQNLKRFYCENGEFYFVNSLDSKRVFKPFVESFINYIEIDQDKLDLDFIESVMEDESSALEIVKDNNALMLNDDFKNALEKLIPGIKRELNGNEANDEDFIDDDERHVISALDNEDFENDEDRDFDEVPVVDEDQYEDENIDDKDHFHRSDMGESHNYPSERKSPVSTGAERVPSSTNSYRTGEKTEHSQHSYTDHSGWSGRSGNSHISEPKPFSPEDVSNFGSNGKMRFLKVLEPTNAEIDDLNRILDCELTSAQIADSNYLAQLRLYRNLQEKGMEPEESEADFIQNAHLMNEHSLKGGKYIHKCSAYGGIMYLSPSIWNKIEDDNCVVCVYFGPKANEFMYFESVEDILKWVKEDDIVIKLTGEEKADVVQRLYSGVLNGVKGTAYTMIRIASNEEYNSIFAPMTQDPNEIVKENKEDY